jgi:D-3-phosphoglycerate dehydrogenase
MPRLVEKRGCRLEIGLEGILMLFMHRDVPGVIGKVGSVFGRHRVNIAQMSVGRSTDKPGGEQIGVLALDSQPPAEAVSELMALDPIKWASVVTLPPADQLPAWMGG